MIVVSTTASNRMTRVVGDVNGLMHGGDSPDAKARAQRWVALTLAEVAQARHWRFLDRVVNVYLRPGGDVLELVGDLDKVVMLHCRQRLRQTTLARITAARVVAAETGRPNGGVPTDYAIERGRRLHLWPAPVGSAVTFTADAATDTLTLASGALTKGQPVAVVSSGQLPAPLSAAATYWALPVAGSQVRLAASVDDVLTGTAIDLTTAGTGTLTLTPLTRMTLLYTAPMDVAAVPDHFEPLLVNGALGLYGRHFDRDTLTEDAAAFEVRYRTGLRRAGVLDHDFERTYPHEDLMADQQYGRASNADLGTAQSHTVPASLSGIGYVTVELGPYPLVVV